MKSTHRNSGCDSLWKKSVFIKIVQILYPYPPAPFPQKGGNVGLPPSPCLGLRPKPHFQKTQRFIDRLG